MTAAYFEDHPTDPDKVILRKPRHEEDDDIQDYKKPWVGLTHGEVIDIYEAVMKENVAELVDNFARALETKLKEKNT
jgi:hypothetical protein